MPRQTMACSLPVLCCGTVKLMRQLRHVPHVLERQFERLTKPSAGTRLAMRPQKAARQDQKGCVGRPDGETLCLLL